MAIEVSTLSKMTIEYFEWLSLEITIWFLLETSHVSFWKIKYQINQKLNAIKICFHTVWPFIYMHDISWKISKCVNQKFWCYKKKIYHDLYLDLVYSKANFLTKCQLEITFVFLHSFFLYKSLKTFSKKVSWKNILFSPKKKKKNFFVVFI